MQYNPYAAPETGGGALPPGPPRNAGPEPWELGEVLGQAWNAFKPNWATLVFSQLIGGLLGGLPNYLPAALVLTHTIEQNSSQYWAIYFSCFAVGIAVNAFFYAGLVRIGIEAARGGTPQFGDLFAGGPHYLSMLGCTVITLLTLTVGCGLFLIPGLILALGLWFAPYFIVDQNLGPIEAMKASWAATTGQKFAILGLALMSVLVILAGYAACCVGVFVALPVASLTWAIVYTRISGTSAQPNVIRPPVGYGPPGMY